MKILIAHDTYYPDVNGAAYFTFRLAKYLKRAGHEILVIAPSLTRKSYYSVYEGINEFRVWSLPAMVVEDFRFCLPIVIKRKISKAIVKFNPDVIHVQGHFPLDRAVVSIAKKKKIPLVGTNHFMPDNLSHYIPLPRRAVKKLENLAWKDCRRVFEKMDVITTPTKTAANLLYKIGVKKNVRPISCGIDFARYGVEKADVDLKKKYKISNKPILLFVGRVDKEKNIDVVLKALPKVLKKCDLQFVVIGKGGEMENLKALAEGLEVDKNVTFTGFMPNEDLPKFIPLADCFVLACAVELQSIATMEAMLSGLPVVAVNAMALPELVHNGKNGYLFEVGDSEGLAKHLIKIFSNKNLRKKMSDESLKIISGHDINKTIKSFEEVYKLAISRKK